MPITSQNWDGVTPPAVPSGWTIDGTLETAAISTPSPVSSPNVLQTTSTANSTVFATYDTADGNSGNVVAQAYFACSTVNASKKATVGLTCQGSATTLNTTSTTWLRTYIDFSGSNYGFDGYISGTYAVFASWNVAGAFASNTWYLMTYQQYGPQAELVVQRVTDGYYLSPSGWQSSPYTTSCTPSFTNGSGYAGCSFLCTSGTLYTDSYSLSDAAAPSPPPLPPVIVRVPAQYAPAWSY